MKVDHLQLEITFLLTLIIPLVAFSVSITVDGSWMETIDTNDLTGGAGSDLEPNHYSSIGEITIEVSDATANHWTVSINRSGTNWPSGVRLVAKRTGDGEGSNPSWVSGGTTFLEVTETPTEFFNGYKDRNSITVQIGIENVSVDVAPDTYAIDVIYTIVRD